MVQFLSDAWIHALGAAADGAPVDPELSLVVQQVVTGEGTEVAYAVRVGDGRISVSAGRVDDADISFTQDRATARSIARGELAAQAAFMDGRLRVGGDLRSLLRHAPALATLDDVFAPARAATDW